MIARSLRVRLAVLGLLSIAAILALAALGLAALFERHVTRRVTAELDTYVRQLAAEVSIGVDGAIGLARAPADPRFSEPYGGLYWQIEGETNATPLRSRSLWDFVIGLPRDELLPGTLHQHRLKGPSQSRIIVSERRVVLTGATQGRSVRIAAAADEREITSAVRDFMRDTGIALLALAAALGLASWLQVVVGLRPLAQLRSAVASIRAGRTAKLDLPGPSEVMPLVQEVNSLLADRAASIEAAKRRAGDLAHGLKTPLTVLVSDVERLRAKGETEIAAEIEDLATGMQRHIQHELSRARIQASGRSGDPVLLKSAVDRLVRTLTRTPLGSRLDWAVAIPEEISVKVREDDLLEMLGAILDNAVKWAKGRVSVRAGLSQDLCILVEDDGHGVPDGKLFLLGDRGVRLDEAKEGTGLGLSIAREIAQKYGGHLKFEKSPLGGLSVSTVFPVE